MMMCWIYRHHRMQAVVIMPWPHRLYSLPPSLQGSGGRDCHWGWACLLLCLGLG